MTEIEIRQQMVGMAKRLYDRNMLAAADGNISVRLNDDFFLFTPTGRAKAFIDPAEIAVTRFDGEVFSGSPSGERAMHLEIYRLCRKAKAIVHAHPVYATAWSLARPEWTELPSDLLSETILGVGRVPIVPYARPGSEDMGMKLRPFLPECRALILSRHGAVAWGEDLEEAMNGLERIEHSAETLYLAEQLGGAKPLPSAEIDALKEIRKKFGDRSL